MRLFPRLARNSAVYSAANLLQRALGVVLLPLYTRLLSPEENGILGVVGSLSLFLNVIVLLALNGAVTRFYFEYRDRPDELRDFWGTLVSFVLLVAASVGGALLLAGEPLLTPVLGEVPFHPFMVLGIVAALFQPVYDIFLSVLQTQERSAAYGLLAIASFLVKTTACIVLVAGLHLGAEGALSAVALVSGVFFFVSLAGLRGHVRFCLRRRHLMTALRYALPLFPHTLAGQGRLIVDRLLVNLFVGAAAAGLYHVAFQVGNLVQVVAVSCNRAFTPIFMSAMKDDDAGQLGELRRIGLILVFGQCLVAGGLGIFAREVLTVLTGPVFHGVFPFVPLLGFAFALNGIYFLFSSVLFYERDLVSRISVITVVTAAVGLGLNLLLVPRWGMAGATGATFVTQLFFTVVTGVVAHRRSRVRWPYGKFALLVGISLTTTLLLNPLGQGVTWEVLALKTAALALLVAAMSAVVWRDPLYAVRHPRRLFDLVRAT